MSKAEIFNRIRSGLRVTADDEIRRQAVRARLEARAPNLIPQRAQLPEAEPPEAVYGDGAGKCRRTGGAATPR